MANRDIKKDVKKGIDEGIAAFKEGATVVSEKVGELTAEGKRQYKVYDLKSKIHGQMTVLGGNIHPLRVAVSGVAEGPGLFEMLAIIGRERVCARLRKAAEIAG